MFVYIPLSFGIPAKLLRTEKQMLQFMEHTTSGSVYKVKDKKRFNSLCDTAKAAFIRDPIAWAFHRMGASEIEGG